MKFWNRKIQNYRYIGFYCPIVGHKHFETEVSYIKDEKNWYSYFNFSIRWDRKISHAGFHIGTDILGVNFSLEIYDDRHWNHDKNRWYIDEERKLDSE